VVRALWRLCVVALVACGPRAAEDGADAALPTAAESGLIASLEVRLEGDTAELVLHVTNALAQPVDLEYATAQRHDFAIYTAAGEEVWRWSADRLFAQASATQRLESGATVEHREAWAASGAAGRYIAEGRLVSLNHPVALRTEFEVPTR
jgi:hypothetical protein